jgi:ribonuclease HI
MVCQASPVPLAVRHRELWNQFDALDRAQRKGGIARISKELHPSLVAQRRHVCADLVAKGFFVVHADLAGTLYAYQITPAGLERWRRGPTYKPMTNPVVKITTDGSCWNKDKGGGFGVVMRFGDKTKEIVGGRFENTTSARMEILGMLVALEHLTPGYQAELFCDNQYVVFSVSKRWVFGWAQDNFLKVDEKTGQLVERPNADLWRHFLQLWQKFPPGTVELKWVKGHAGDPDNERCDELAGQGRLSKTILADDVTALNLLR